MKRASLAAALALLMLAGALFGKEKRIGFYTPHPVAGQNCTDLNGSTVDKGPGIAQKDDQSDVMVVMTAQADRVVRVAVSIFNNGSRAILFTPSTAFVTLPNGHSYAPYTQTDAIEALVRSESAGGNSNAGYNPPPDTLKTDCTTIGSTTNCTSAVDSGQRGAYDLGYGIGTAINKAIDAHHLNKQVKALREYYLTSREIDPGKELAGGIDVYVEDVNGGPFKITLPIGSKTYTFVFGPSGTNEKLKK